MIKIYKDVIVTYVCGSCEHQWEELNPDGKSSQKYCPSCGKLDDVEKEKNDSVQSIFNVFNPFYPK